MGKKSMKQASEKAPKNHEKQLHSLIKVLKPKVYITESSNFKQLVQDLTSCGGGAQAEILTQPMPMPMPMPQLSENIPVIDISSDVSGGSEIDSYCEVYDQLINEEVNCPVYMDSRSTALDLTYRNLESWLLDPETCNWYEVFSQSREQISVFDYNVAGLLKQKSRGGLNLYIYIPSFFPYKNFLYTAHSYTNSLNDLPTKF